METNNTNTPKHTQGEWFFSNDGDDVFLHTRINGSINGNVMGKFYSLGTHSAIDNAKHVVKMNNTYDELVGMLLFLKEHCTFTEATEQRIEDVLKKIK